MLLVFIESFNKKTRQWKSQYPQVGLQVGVGGKFRKTCHN
jgi:hypothetical protein